MNNKGFGVVTVILIIFSIMGGGFLFGDSLLFLPGDNIVQKYSGCVDSDGGQNFFEKGQTCFRDKTAKSTYCISDLCITDVILSENYCANNTGQIIYYFCEFGCESGACIQLSHLECIDNTCTVVEGEGDNHCLSEGSTCGSSAQTCIDNDVLGNELERFYARGGSWDANSASTDKCSVDELVEYYCGDSEEEYIEYVCPWGCGSGNDAGGCWILNDDPCYDSDGNNLFVAGCVTKSGITLCDFCSVGAPFITVYEARCLGPSARYIETTCGPSGCINGRCGGEYHLGCIDNMCRNVNGPGINECSNQGSPCN